MRKTAQVNEAADIDDDQILFVWNEDASRDLVFWVCWLALAILQLPCM